MNISPLARIEYERGTSPLDYAEQQVTTLLVVHHSVTIARLDNPDAFRGWPIPPTAHGIGHQVIAELLSAGWQFPAEPYDEHMDSLAAVNYSAGVDPEAYAKGVATMLIARHDRLDAVPPSLRCEGLDLSPDALARRILGALMNAGWQMPVWPIPEPHQEAA